MNINKKVRSERFHKIVPQMSHVKVANNNYSKVPIGDNDNIKNLYRHNYGSYVKRLDKQNGVQEGFCTPKIYRSVTPQARDFDNYPPPKP